MDMITFLGQRLRELRHRHGLSQYELARRSGVPQTTIWRLENNGQKRIDVGIVRKLAIALNVDVDYLVGTHEPDIDTEPAALAIA